MGRICFVVLVTCLFAQVAKAQAPGSITWAGTPHGIALTCTASTSTVTGYNFYRGTVSGGPYTKINAALIPACSFLDPASGLSLSTNYFYVVTAVDANANESIYSNQASVTTPAVFPQNPAPPSNLAGKSQ